MVLFQGESAMRSHRRLFSLNEDCYLAAGRSITESILLSSEESVVKLHVVTGWRDMLKIALWTPGNLSQSDVFAFMKNICTLPEGLDSATGDVDRIFRRLYDSGRLDVFRKVCRAAKSITEAKIGRERLLVHCHLVSDGNAGIVASSL